MSVQMNIVFCFHHFKIVLPPPALSHSLFHGKVFCLFSRKVHRIDPAFSITESVKTFRKRLKVQKSISFSAPTSDLFIIADIINFMLHIAKKKSYGNCRAKQLV